MCLCDTVTLDCSVNNGGCSQLCHHSSDTNTTTSATQPHQSRCFCESGYQLHRDKRTCTGQLSTGFISLHHREHRSCVTVTLVFIVFYVLCRQDCVMSSVCILCVCVPSVRTVPYSALILLVGRNILVPAYVGCGGR